MNKSYVKSILLVIIFIPGCFDGVSTQGDINNQTRVTAKAIETSGVWGVYTEAGPLFTEDKEAVKLSANILVKNRLYPSELNKILFNDIKLEEMNGIIYLAGSITKIDLYDKSETQSYVAMEMEKDNDGNIILGTVTNECIGDPCSQCKWENRRCDCEDYTTTNHCNHKLTIVEDSSE